MANYKLAFDKLIKNEGGYVNDPKDPGGETYKGIARTRNPKWDGWPIVDKLKKQAGFIANLDANAELQQKVQTFYQLNYWNAVKGDLISNQDVAFSVFDFGVNAGIGTSVKLAQKVVGSGIDGVIGSDTINKINACDPKLFLNAFAVAKVRRYIAIVKNDADSKKFFYGWISRTVEDI